MSNAQTLYQALFETLQGLQNGTVTIEKAKAVSDVAQTITNVAKVEVDYLRVAQNKKSDFFNGTAQTLALSKQQGSGAQVQFDDTKKTNAQEIYNTVAGGKVERMGNVTRHTTR